MRMSSADSSTGVRRVTADIGAEITGVRAGPDLPAEVVRTIRGAFSWSTRCCSSVASTI